MKDELILLADGNKDTMLLGASHSLYVSNAPSKINFNQFNDTTLSTDRKDTIEKFGLFGSNNDYNKYSPDITPEDFIPTDEDFIEPVFRMLSSCIVAKNRMPTEFPESVLKASMNLLVGQSIYPDHEDDTINTVGSVKSVAWQSSYTIDGVVIPSGINGVFKIDAKSNPRLARGIMMDPPSIHSNSVTVEFEWKPSHKFEKAWEFYDALGSIHEDGTMVRRIVTRIVNYKETSLVPHGADPFAQIIKNGKLNNVVYANRAYYGVSQNSLNEKPGLDEIAKQVDIIDFKIKDTFTSMSLTEHNTKPIINYNKDNKNPKNPMNEELLKSLGTLAAVLNLTADETLTTQMLVDKVTTMKNELVTAKSDVTRLTSENETLTVEKTQLTKDLDQYKSDATIGVSYVKSTRDEAVQNYLKLSGESKDDNILALLNDDKTSVQTLISLNKTYVNQLEEKFPMKCSECGSIDVTRASSIAEDKNSEYNKKKVGSPSDSVREIIEKQ